MNEEQTKMEGKRAEAGRKYIVMDVVFYGSSLNYDQGESNYQELKKITKWDGRQYILVSRYALRYSILHWANKLFPNGWRLAGNDVLTHEEGGVARIKSPREINNQKYCDFMKDIFLKYPEFDLFGFMIAPKTQGSKGVSITRTSPVKISHAVSLTPYNYDSQFTANLDIMKRAAGPGAGSNPVTIEEKKDFYAYNVVIDVDRIGRYTKEEHGNEDIGDIDVSDKRNDRIESLVETIFNLKREIKGRMEDLSPWLVICGLYTGGKYDTYSDRIELAKSHIYKIITKEKETNDSEGRVIKEIEHETVERDAPKFEIDIGESTWNAVTREEMMKKIDQFLNGKSGGPRAQEGGHNNADQNKSEEELSNFKVLVYKRPSIEVKPIKEKNE